MTIVNVPQLLNRWQQRNLSDAELKRCLEETKALTQELANHEGVSPKRVQEVVVPLFVALEGGFRDQLKTLIARELPDQNADSVISVIRGLMKTFKPFQDRDKEYLRILEKCRWQFMIAFRQAKHERGIREKTFFDLLPTDLKKFTVEIHPSSQWLNLGLLSQGGYRKAVASAINDIPFKAKTFPTLAIENSTDLVDMLKIYGENLARLNLSGCDFVTDAHLQQLARCGSLQELDLRGCRRITSEGIKSLLGLKNLMTLLLGGENLTNQSLRLLAELVNLQRLSFESYPVEITDADIASLPGLINLQCLHLPFCAEISDAAFEHFARFTQLQTLEVVHAVKITDAGVRNFAGLVNLQKLSLHLEMEQEESQITDNGLAHFAALVELRELDLTGRILLTGSGLAHLHGLSHLETLTLADCEGITNEGMKAIGGLTSLQNLSLGFLALELIEDEDSKISEEGYAHLARLTNLRRLDLEGRSINDAGLQYLAGLENLTRLVLASDHITDAGLQHLARLQNLTRLVLISEQITDEGRAWLKEKLPNTVITHH